MPTAPHTKTKSATPRAKPPVAGKTLDDLFLHGIQDIYYAEKKLTKALPKMIKAAQSPDLKEALEKHLGETEEHVTKVEQVFAILDRAPKAVKCAAIDGIVEEAEEILKDFAKTQSGDAAIIFSGQAAEHYEITRYGSLRAFAEVLGMEDAAEILQSILDQEKAADTKLSELADERINFAAEGRDDAPEPTDVDNGNVSWGSKH